MAGAAVTAECCWPGGRRRPCPEAAPPVLSQDLGYECQVHRQETPWPRPQMAMPQRKPSRLLATPITADTNA